MPGGVDTTVFMPEGRERRPSNARHRPVDASPLHGATARAAHGAREPDRRDRGCTTSRACGSSSPAQGRAAEFEAQRDRLGLVGRVDLIGRVSDAELPLWHRAADLFVLPTVAYEGFGLVTARLSRRERRSWERRSGRHRSSSSRSSPGLLARGTEPGALAEAIREGLSLATPEFRERCREYALARFSWDAVLPCWERAPRGCATPQRRAVAWRPLISARPRGQ